MLIFFPIVFRVGTFGAMLEYGCEKKITQFSHLGASVTVGVPVGVSVKFRYKSLCKLSQNDAAL